MSCRASDFWGDRRMAAESAEAVAAKCKRARRLETPLGVYRDGTIFDARVG